MAVLFHLICVCIEYRINSTNCGTINFIPIVVLGVRDTLPRTSAEALAMRVGVLW